MANSPVKPSVRPKDLGNDKMFVRTRDSILTHAGTRVALNLSQAKPRAVARRFAERIIALCDYWENMSRAKN